MHLPALLTNPAAELVAICDADLTRLQAAAQAYSIGHTYTDHLQMLEREQVDGVIIATPHATHVPLARDCLREGLHVLIEKPMTLYAAHARDLVLLAREQRRELLIGYPEYPPPRRSGRRGALERRGGALSQRRAFGQFGRYRAGPRR